MGRLAEARGLEPDQQLVAVNVIQVKLWAQEPTAQHTAAPVTTAANTSMKDRWARRRSKVGLFYYYFYFFLSFLEGRLQGWRVDKEGLRNE